MRNFFFGIFLLSLALIIILLKSDLFTIRQAEIETSNLGCADKDQIKNIAPIQGQNFFALDEKKLAKDLSEKFICIKDVNLLKTLPNKVKIEVRGRDPAVILASLDQPFSTPSADEKLAGYLADNDGVVFAKNTGDLTSPTVYHANLDISLGKKLEVLGQILKILDKIKILGIETPDNLINDDDFWVNPYTTPKIIFRLNDKIDIQLASLQLILDKAKIDSEKLEFIDLRFDKPVVQFAPYDHGQR